MAVDPETADGAGSPVGPGTACPCRCGTGLGLPAFQKVGHLPSHLRTGFAMPTTYTPRPDHEHHDLDALDEGVIRTLFDVVSG